MTTTMPPSAPVPSSSSASSPSAASASPCPPTGAHYLVELYTPNARWLALSPEQRRDFFKPIQAAMGDLSALGVEVLALGESDSGIAQASNRRFLGVWRFPDVQARDALLAGIAACGWYDYFEHVNAATQGGTLTQHLAQLDAA